MKKIYISAAVLLFLIIAYFVIKREIKALQNTSKKAKKDIVKKELSYSPAWYGGAADSLHEAMDGPGTNISTIEHIILQLKNKSDWSALVVAFGQRGTQNLYGWLHEDLGYLQAEDIREILNKIDVTNF